MDAFEKFDRLKDMINERLKAKGFEKSRNSMAKSTEIMKPALKGRGMGGRENVGRGAPAPSSLDTRAPFR